METERKKDKRGQNVIYQLHFIGAFYVKHVSQASKTASILRIASVMSQVVETSLNMLVNKF